MTILTNPVRPASQHDRRDDPGAPRPAPGSSVRADNLMAFAVVIAGMALFTAIVAVGFGARAIDDAKAGGGGGTAVGAPATATVHLSEFKLEPATVTVATGGSLQLMNMGSTAHNVAIKGTDRASAMIEGGGVGTLELAGLSAGTYTMYCQVAGHEQAGMRATLKIVNGGAADGTASGTGAATPAAMTPDQMDAAMAKSISAFPAKTAGLGAQILAPTVLADGTKQFELTSSIVKWEVEPGKFVDAWTYNGTVPGPTLKVDPGDKVSVVLHNQLPESTAIHFHGLITPSSMDGTTFVTQPPVKSGETFTYSFTAQSTPAVDMYHSHHNAVHQVPDGLAGAILVGQLPVPAGVTVSQQYNMMLNDAGVIGFSLNGKSFPATAPVVAKQGEWIEVNYLNEGVMAHPMHMHGMPQMVIAKDGIPLAQPYEADTINVSPGERYTVLIHATEVGTWVWHCHILTHAESMEKGMFGMVTALVVT